MQASKGLRIIDLQSVLKSTRHHAVTIHPNKPPTSLYMFLNEQLVISGITKN